MTLHGPLAFLSLSQDSWFSKDQNSLSFVSDSHPPINRCPLFPPDFPVSSALYLKWSDSDLKLRWKKIWEAFVVFLQIAKVHHRGCLVDTKNASEVTYLSNFICDMSDLNIDLDCLSLFTSWGKSYSDRKMFSAKVFSQLCGDGSVTTTLDVFFPLYIA